MKVIPLQKKMTEEEYFLFEEESEMNHELVDGNLIEMSHVSSFHNEISGNIYLLLRSLLRGRQWKVFIESFKIKTPDGNYFLPDVSICHPQIEKYFSILPMLVIEVLSDKTRKYDLVDKFIQYRKIETLQYYLCIEPEQQVVMFYLKQDDGEWVTETLTKDEDAINLPKLNISFTLEDIYKS